MIHPNQIDISKNIFELWNLKITYTTMWDTDINMKGNIFHIIYEHHELSVTVDAAKTYSTFDT